MVLRTGCVILLYQFLIIAYLFTFPILISKLFSLVAILKLSQLLKNYHFDNEVGIIGNALFFLKLEL